VFGDSEAKSQSLTKSLDLLNKSFDKLYPVNVGMLNALKNIERGMSGLANIVARNAGVANGTNMGIQEGTLSRTSNGATGIGIAAGTVGGMAIGTNIGMGIGAIGGPIGMAIGAVVGALAGSLVRLWGKTTQNIVDSGIKIQGSLEGIRKGQGISQYASVDTTTSKWFGLSKKTTNSVQEQGVSGELSSQIGLIFNNMALAMEEAAKVLYGKSDDVTKVLEGLSLSVSSVSLKGLKGDDLTKALNAIISKSLDEMAEAAFKDFDKFRGVGEGYAETILRVANSFATTNSVLSQIGLTLFKTNMAGIDASMMLVELVGGLENLQSVSKSYLENYFTEDERKKKTLDALTAQFKLLNEELPTSRDLFRKMLETASELGQTEKVAKLLTLSDAFASLFPAVDKATKDAEDLTKKKEELAAKEELLSKVESDNRRDELSQRKALAEQSAKAMASITESIKTITDAAMASAPILMKAGDAQGLLANSALSARGFTGFTNTKQTAKSNLEYAAQASSSALSSVNVAGIIGSLISESMSSSFTDKLGDELKQQIAPSMSTTLSRAMQGAFNTAGKMVAMSEFGLQGTGVANVLAAKAKAEFDSVSTTVKMGGDVVAVFGRDVISYLDTVDTLNRLLKVAAISQAEYSEGIDTLNRLMGDVGELSQDLNAQLERMQNNAKNLVSSGLASIGHYFGEITKASDALAASAAAANTPLSQAVGSIGRLGSLAYVLTESTSAVKEGTTSQIKSLRNSSDYADNQSFYENKIADLQSQSNSGPAIADMIAIAATTASSVITTADASKAAESLAKTEAFTGVVGSKLRDISLYLDGVKQFDAQAFENSFTKINAALIRGAITQEQYNALFNESLGIFKTGKTSLEAANEVANQLAKSAIDAAATSSAIELAAGKDMVDTFKELQKAAKSLTESLLLDEKYSPLSSADKIAEASRQFYDNLDKALGGDSAAVSAYTSTAERYLAVIEANATDKAQLDEGIGAVLASDAYILKVDTTAKTQEEMLLEIKKLRLEIVDLRSAQESTASSSGTTASVLKQFREEGIPPFVGV